MVVEHSEIEITVTRLKVRCLKVSHPNGHDVVVGGRLVSSTRSGVTVPRRDLPPYRMCDFPVDFTEWLDGGKPEVTVEIVDRSGFRKVGPVRACTLLFTERDARTVTEWIRSQR